MSTRIGSRQNDRSSTGYKQLLYTFMSNLKGTVRVWWEFSFDFLKAKMARYSLPPPIIRRLALKDWILVDGFDLPIHHLQPHTIA
jgi:hypothetical protein